MMPVDDVHICSICALHSEDDEDFSTDVNAEVDEQDMTCEGCYDDMNKHSGIYIT